MTQDLFGFGWRHDIAADLFMNLKYFDITEVILDDYLNRSESEWNTLKFLSSQIPITLHGVGLGLASQFSIDKQRLQKISQLMKAIQPVSWSEHIAFVRAPEIEIGHLAAPPRNQDTINALHKNLKLVEEVIGSLPDLENIATLLEPPVSTMSEPKFLKNFFEKTKAGFLFDLHNFYANSINFGLDPFKEIFKYPLHRVKQVHLSGGCFVQEKTTQKFRLLDDHKHDVPADVFSLLELLASVVKQKVIVIIERDGHYPSFNHMIEQLEMARQSVKRGRLQNIETAYELI